MLLNHKIKTMLRVRGERLHATPKLMTALTTNLRYYSIASLLHMYPLSLHFLQTAYNTILYVHVGLTCT